MRKKLLPLLAGIWVVVTLTSCGSDPALTQFKKDMDSFCTSVTELHEAINNIDAEAENAAALALDYLDDLDRQFQEFAELDFPEEYDYLEELADEAGEYMKESVQSYHDAYADGGYDESIAAYARENSARALKRLQVILDVLRGEDPYGTDSSESQEPETSGTDNS